MKIVGVIVTFNRLNSLRICLAHMMQQTLVPDRIYIVNNHSTDGTGEYLQRNRQDRWSVINLEQNTGGAGGFYTGIKRAYEEGADCIWGMDDDAYPERNALFNIVNAAKQDGFQNVYWSNCDKDRNFINNEKLVSEWMFVGFFITRKAIESAGLPEKDFFIYHDDVEYAYRLAKKGYKIYKIKNSAITHKDSISDQFYEKNFYGSILKYPKLPDWKQYYYVRNYILRYSWKDIRRYKTIFIICPWFFFKLCVLNPAQCKIFLKAYLHGILGISGVKIKP